MQVKKEERSALQLGSSLEVITPPQIKSLATYLLVVGGGSCEVESVSPSTSRHRQPPSPQATKTKNDKLNKLKMGPEYNRYQLSPSLITV